MSAEEELPTGKTRGKRHGLTNVGLAGGAFLAVARWLVRIAHILTVVLLARLLEPAEYGLVALAKIVSNLVLVGNFGLQAAVIQREEEVDERMLDVSWTYDKLLLNLVLATTVFLSAPFVASFFEQPEMLNVVRALALVPVVQGLENNAIIILTRQLEYRKRFWLEAVNGLGMLVVVVPLALIWQNVWAFVVAYLFGLLLRAMLSYVFYPRLPRIRFDADVFRELFGFGRWMIVLKLVTSAREQAAPLLLGKVLGPEALAFFHIGARFSAQLSADITQTARKVLFPIYSKIQSDPVRLARGYRTAVQISLLAVGPFAAVLAVLAEPAIVTVFGEKWIPSVPIVQILCLAGVLKTLTGTIHPLLRGRGFPQLELALNAVYTVTVLPLLAILAGLHGVVGAAEAVLIAEVVQVPIWMWLCRNVAGVSALAILRGAWIPGLVAGASAGAAALATMNLNAGSVPKLVVGGSASLSCYVLAVWLGGHRAKLAGLDVLAERGGQMLGKVWVRR